MQDCKTKSTVVFLCGLAKNEFSLLCDELQQSRNLIGLPALIPICLLELKAEVVDESLQTCHGEIHQVKVNTGMARKSSHASRVSDYEQFDFAAIGRMLTGITATLATCELACETHLMLLEHLDRENRRFMSSVLEEQRAAVAKAMNTLEKRRSFLQCRMQYVGPRTKYLSQRSQAYVQTVRGTGIYAYTKDLSLH